ncbi:hypothetical protein HanIR_Chr12g0571531 [Helianthus annuus]|nr:hypothetical protein HanIR_Chr12g0571531 [Helianthus annuus]
MRPDLRRVSDDKNSFSVQWWFNDSSNERRKGSHCHALATEFYRQIRWREMKSRSYLAAPVTSKPDFSTI